MKIYVSKNFSPAKAWDALDIANFFGTSVRLHWTNQPYKWHINDGEEVFAVLDGVVEMHYREAGEVKKVLLNSGDIFYASIGTEHVAHPQGEARVLVIEKEDSV
ncbi:cupin [Pantoea sp. PNT02]|jgi:mannose-6-phosphate isomerase-like protein (cupin superfamily)|uniref:cupin n=1 Tax=Pantoea TaxID=53335 RepID=UPI00178043F6|nr:MULTISPECIES: cupin [Pantoea]MBD9644655.1 cupin [Pantoea sp. PNT02]MDR6352945.1 mannose-6-phosphate isomerase-like protein (cupin superfamily) [Pantoea sp. SORGH_AS_0659]WGK59702.1 cupin [Pantoea sp. SS70]